MANKFFKYEAIEKSLNLEGFRIKDIFLAFHSINKRVVSGIHLKLIKYFIKTVYLTLCYTTFSIDMKKKVFGDYALVY